MQDSNCKHSSRSSPEDILNFDRARTQSQTTENLKARLAIVEERRKRERKNLDNIGLWQLRRLVLDVSAQSDPLMKGNDATEVPKAVGTLKVVSYLQKESSINSCLI